MIRVLRTENQIGMARRQLRAAGCDSSRGWWRLLYATSYLLRFRKLAEPVAVNKSWDVWTMLQAAKQSVPDPSARVFEMGSFNSEIPLALWRSGYRNIRASDFNPLGRAIRWYGNDIEFRCEDFYNPDLAPRSVDLMTALSVIEHGYDRDRLVDTADRLLAPGGMILITTDYHKEKISIPADFRLFGLKYQMFSKEDIEELVAAAGRKGLTLVGDAVWEESEYPIPFLGHDMTFLFLALRKAA